MTETERFAWFPCWERDWTDERTGRTYTMKSPRGRALYEQVGDYSWQRAAADPDKAARMRRPWNTRYPCWGLALPTGVVAIDCDIDHDDPSITGWDMMQGMTGCVYGSAGIPRTVVSRTPSGGAHLLYRVPDGVQLMDIVHQPVDGVTVPLDIRLGGRGYIIAPGSRTMAGRYRLVDVPDGEELPTLTPALGGLLVRLGAVAGAGPRRPKAKPMIPRACRHAGAWTSAWARTSSTAPPCRRALATRRSPRRCGGGWSTTRSQSTQCGPGPSTARWRRDCRSPKPPAS